MGRPLAVLGHRMSKQRTRLMIKKWFTALGKTPLVREGAPILGLYWVYSTIRWFIARNTPYEAFANAFRIIDLERHLGIFYESAIQSWLIDHAMSLVHVSNAFYTLGYFPVLITCGVLLYRFDSDRFQIFKGTFLLTLGFALICFSLFPLAPPRMLPGVGFVDTQDVYSSGLYNHKVVLSFYNPYAAMPSLHFGWALLMGIIACSLDRRIFKIMGIIYPSLMALVIVITGHHYFADIVGGGIAVGLAYALVKALPGIVKGQATHPIGVHDKGVSSSGVWSADRSEKAPPSRKRNARPGSTVRQGQLADFVARLTRGKRS
jgi:hypothetical protein